MHTLYIFPFGDWIIFIFKFVAFAYLLYIFNGRLSCKFFSLHLWSSCFHISSSFRLCYWKRVFTKHCSELGLFLTFHTTICSIPSSLRAVMWKVRCSWSACIFVLRVPASYLRAVGLGSSISVSQFFCR